ncbi:plasmid mobilization relaxosome protein MobC [Pilimelia columellifera]|uniref:Bacterial mobilisation domain-containing protein n=1 Tax=Pilimelia columellifera subsp. columellifera TaxID=706583 RepID=A0ABP6B582_9ACTN
MAGKDKFGATVRGAVTGRRRQRAADGRPHVVRVTYSADELAQVRALAACARLATATFVAEASLDPIRPHPGDDLGEVRELLRELMSVHRQLRGACTNLNQAVAAFNSTGVAPEQLAEIAAYVRRVTTAVDHTLVKVVEVFPGRR